LEIWLAALGEDHQIYGARARDYENCAEALLWAVSHGLGSRFCNETRSAWSAFCALLSNAMQSASSQNMRIAGAA
jgi:hemoglobin-like flavoprotein